MRIGYDAKRYFHNRSGLGNYSRDLIRALSTYYPANEYYLYTPSPSSVSIPESATIQLPQRSLLNTLLPSFWRSKRIVQDLKRDAVDIFHGLSGEIPRDLSHVNVRSVVSIHDLIFLRHPELYKWIDRSIYVKKFRYAALRADKVVAISQQTKSDIIHYFKLPEERIEVIYQGCHPSFKTAKSMEELEAVRRKYRLPAQFVLNVGSIEPRKNAFQIVKAIEQLDIPLVIVGKQTPYAAQIRRYIIDKKLEHRVIFPKVEHMEDLAAMYRLSSIFVYPSSYEGFGIPIIEALFSGTPVITTNSGVFPEAAGPSSRFIDPQNVDEIVYAIDSVLSSSSKQKEMKEQGLIYAQQFSDQVLAAQWASIYKSLG